MGAAPQKAAPNESDAPEERPGIEWAPGLGPVLL